jgi:hypothetical protein
VLKRISLWLLLALGLWPSVGQAQVGVGILDPDSCAILHLESVKRGFLPPRMTTVQRDAIVNPKAGLLIFNTQDSLLEFWNGQCWLATWQQDCGDCAFRTTLSSLADTIDRALTDSVVVDLNITQTFGNPQNIAFTLVNTLPTGMTLVFRNNPLFSSGQASFLIRVTPFVPAGTYPIIIQVLCGGGIRTLVYSVTLTPCYYVSINNSVNNYNLAQALYALYPTASTTQPLCIVAQVQSGVTVGSDTSTTPAFITGILPSGSVVQLINDGWIFGKGGKGGTAYAPVSVPPSTGEGEDGGHAIELTTGPNLNFTLTNNGYIFGGGGGGASMAFDISYSFGSLPVIGSISIGFLIGGGGGGGAGGGPAGNFTGTYIGPTYYQGGTPGTTGLTGVPGVGGTVSYAINFGAGPASISILPYVKGGDGGAYGYPGNAGIFVVNINISVNINIPFIGNIVIPVYQGPLNIPVPPPLPGAAGYSLKRNSSTVLNYQDLLYNTSYLKGRLGP